jgi:hypothetical protein
MKEPHNHKFYAIDKYWFRLQEKDNWFLIIPLTVIQREDYSDIEKKPANYKKVMLDLDKEWLTKNRMQQVTQTIRSLQDEYKPPSQKISMFLS